MPRSPGVAPVPRPAVAAGDVQVQHRPGLEAKVRDVVGLYLDPPEKAIVLCVDEKSQIQALDRTAPMLPLRPGLPERRTHDYVRHGTTTLFAALEIATGHVEQACLPRHRHQEFLRFLKQVAKAYPRGKLSTGRQLRHAQAPRRGGMAGADPRITLHFTPISGSWRTWSSLLRDNHPPGPPSRQLRQRERPHRRHRDLHRRLERALPPVRLDQDGRRDPAPHP